MTRLGGSCGLLRLLRLAELGQVLVGVEVAGGFLGVGRLFVHGPLGLVEDAQVDLFAHIGILHGHFFVRHVPALGKRCNLLIVVVIGVVELSAGART